MNSAQNLFPFDGKLPGPKLLRSTLTSPFGRKVRIAMDVLGLSGRIDVQPADTRDQSDTLRQQNPLGKIPCLILEDGSILYDSRVIIEFLDRWSGQNRLIPEAVDERARILTRATLADGIADAALLMVYEGRFRDPSQISEVWLDHQRGKISRALDAMQTALPDPRKTDVVSISLACALGYLDWRQPVEWRQTYPVIVDWLDEFAAAEAAFGRTERPAEIPA
ncbi:glutathione S-transferase N-terminal domain-containing protein [uncultured Thalassospira sp.]|uniref:glutathione S-transferase N-terminal domain-containing protein n=1 Tax=uncultured Thalassospira sp. TaxID=404382 RepID=UPI00258F3F4F|nr:glutathione S-transferase N-terminal domain-containing protein [uncultured Thalassospira sp.]